MATTASLHIVIAVILFTFFNYGLAHYESRWDFSTQETVKEGDDVTLQFSSKKSNRFDTCYWYKDNQKLNPGYSTNKFEIMTDYVKDCTLRIHRINVDDDGIYFCLIVSKSHQIDKSPNFNISVIVPPKGLRMQYNDRDLRDFGLLKVVQNSNSLTAYCVADDSRPPTSLSWKLNGNRLDKGIERRRVNAAKRKLESTMSSITLDVSNEINLGTLICEAAHPVYTFPGYPPENVRVIITLPVRVQPTIPEVWIHDLNNQRTTMTLFTDESVTLYCKSDGDPPPAYAWARRDFDRSNPKDAGKGQNLTISNRDGFYSCMAYNDPHDKKYSRDELQVQFIERKVEDSNNGNNNKLTGNRYQSDNNNAGNTGVAINGLPSIFVTSVLCSVYLLVVH